jgi:iron complex transport system substrate-binding protein
LHKVFAHEGVGALELTLRKNVKGNFSQCSRLLVLLFAATLLLCLTNCHNQPPAQTTPIVNATDTGFPRTLRDGSGAEVTIKTRPTRIVSQTLGTDEILWAICPRERIVGINQISLEPKYSVLAEEWKAAGIKPISNAEEILQLQPDLIFVASFSRAETSESLQASGATVFRFANFDSIADIQQNIRLVGQAIGEEANADKLVAQMDNELAAVKARIPADRPPPRVLSFSLSGNTAGANTLFDAIVRAAGAVNVAAEQGLSGFPKISPEQVVEWQPDFLVTGADEAKAELSRTQLREHPVIATTKAARAGRIIVLDPRYLLSVSHYITRAVGELANALYSSTSQPSAKAAAK